MEIMPYFEKIEDIIIKDIRASKKQLLIAVAWFTNHKIFDVLIEKLNNNKDFTAKLVVINDNINNRVGGLDFQKIVSLGCSFYFAEKNIPMHNKYVVIDSDIVITGSYNYTYYAESYNEENIIRIKGGGDIVQSYIDNFNKLVENKQEVKDVKEYLRLFPPYVDLFSYRHYALKDLSLQADFLNTNGRVDDAAKLIEKYEEAESKKGYKNYVINDVIYQQWKSYYYIDKIEVRAKRVKIVFRTIVSGGCWLCSPNTPYCWIIRSAINNNIIEECYAVRNVFINNSLVINEMKKGTVCYFYDDKETNDYSNNECGYGVNDDKQMIDSNGNIVPVQQIKTPKNGVLTCEVFFKTDEDELLNGIIDFVEGIGFENKDNHWNAFKIKMNLNRERLS